MGQQHLRHYSTELRSKRRGNLRGYFFETLDGLLYRTGSGPTLAEITAHHSQ